MAEDWAIDVKKYVPDADDAIIKAIVRYCGIALTKRDSSLVSFSDPKETARVRDGYCRKKLALTDADDVVDAAIAKVGDRMKADRTKNRVTVYYLLAEHFGKLGVFAAKAATVKSKAPLAAAALVGSAAAAGAAAGAAKGSRKTTAKAAPAATPKAKAAPKAASGGTSPALVAAAAATTAAAVAATAKPKAPSKAAVAAATPAPVASAPVAASAPAAASLMAAPAASASAAAQPVAAAAAPQESYGWLGLAALVVAALIVLVFAKVFFGDDSGRPASAPNAAVTAPVAATPAPAIATAAIPEGSGVVAETVAGMPKVSVYFDSGKTGIAPDFAAAVAPVKAWIDANPTSRLAVSGFNDPTGNAARNAELSKARAQAVAATLVAQGVPADRIDLVKPADTTATDVDLAQARRVEIVVVPGV